MIKDESKKLKIEDYEKQFENIESIDTEGFDDKIEFFDRNCKSMAIVFVSIIGRLICTKNKTSEVSEYLKLAFPNLNLIELKSLVIKKNTFDYIINAKIEVIVQDNLENMHRFCQIFRSKEMLSTGSEVHM